jgi:hypothetical protein
MNYDTAACLIQFITLFEVLQEITQLYKIKISRMAPSTVIIKIILSFPRPH